MVHQFCNCPGAHIDFGVISEDLSQSISIHAGPIRLMVGFPGVKGFGKLHIEQHPGRFEKIKSLGCASVERFVFEVASKFHRICTADQPSRISVVYQKLEHDLCLVLDFHKDGFWHVITGMPYRIHRRPILWEKTQIGGSESPPKAAEPSRFETLSLPKPIKGIGGSGS